MTRRTVLAIDLSSARGSIAVVCEEEVLFQAIFQSERSHNAQLFTPLQQALSVIGESRAIIAIGTGPGSYTGVRISIAAAQGVALSRGWPVLGWPSITTADLPAYRVLGDARRGQFYTAEVSAGRLTRELEIMTAVEALACLEQTGPWLSFDAKPPLSLSPAALHLPDALVLARLVLQLPEAELRELSARPFEPIYLQEAFITVAKKAGKHVPV